MFRNQVRNASGAVSTLTDTASRVDTNQDQLDWILPHCRWVLDRDEWGFRPEGESEATLDADG